MEISVSLILTRSESVDLRTNRFRVQNSVNVKYQVQEQRLFVCVYSCTKMNALS